jgi:hypothetical protein
MAVAAEVVAGGQSRGHGRRQRGNPFRGDPLLVLGPAAPVRLSVPAPDGLLEFLPERVADPVQVAQRWAQAGAARAAQEGRRDLTILITVPARLEKTQADHGIRDDAKRPPRHAGAPGELVKGNRLLRELLEDPDRAGSEQVLGGHEAERDFHDGIGRDLGHGIPLPRATSTAWPSAYPPRRDPPARSGGGPLHSLGIVT